MPIPTGPASKPWANLDELVAKLMQNSMTENPVLDDVYGAIDQMRSSRETEATAAKGKADALRAKGLPTTGAAADFTQRAAGSIADAFRGSNDRRALAEDLIKQEENQLVLKNQQDLKSLDEAYQKAADRASQLGDLETELKMREKIASNNEKLQAGSDIIRTRMNNEAAADRENIQGKWAVRVAGIRQAGELGLGGGAGGSGLTRDQIVSHSPSGYEFIDLSKSPDAKTKGELWTYGKQNGIPLANDRENASMTMVGDAISNIKMMRELVIPELTKDPHDIAGRMKRQIQSEPKIPYLGIPNPLYGDNPTLGGLRALRTSAIQIIQTLASLGKGLRINQVEIEMARKYDIPEISDPQNIAEAKLRLLEMMVKHVERAALGKSPYEDEPAEIKQMIKDFQESKSAPKVGKPTAKDAKQYKREADAASLLKQLDGLPH
jgi:hypothetical protein